MSQHDEILAALRASTPTSSEPETPVARSPQLSVQTPVQEVRQIYWNEYDNGSEAENEPYTIIVDPDAKSTCLGARGVAYVTSRVREPMERVKAWLGSAT